MIVLKKNNKIIGFKMSEATYHELNESYSGLCLACGDVQDGGTEPDAENYACDSCEQDRVQGIENLLVMGFILIADGDA